MNLTASDRSALIKLASGLPKEDSTRKAILAGLKTASVPKKAHRPTLSGITLAAYREGNAKMMYFIDAVKNHSKFYEILIEEDANGGFVLRRRWGALTDNGAGRVDAKDADGLTEGQAKAMMAGLVREKMSKGYQDAFKTQPVGQYPVGLSRTTGFGWGTQEITKSVPVLRELLENLEYAIRETEEGSVEGLTVALAEVSREMSVLGKSSMAREIETRLKGPLSRLLGHPRFIPSPEKIIMELVSLKNYIAKQLQESNI